MGRFAKQLIISGIYLAAAGLIAFGIYRALVPAPTCTDNIKNQGEEGVDCGTVCGKLCAPTIQPLSVQLSQVVPVTSGNYDIAIMVRNLNSTYGASHVPYTISVNAKDGQLAKQIAGSFYILPGQTRFLVESNISVQGGMPTVQFRLGEPDWQQVNGQVAVAFPIKRESYAIGTSRDYEAVVVNDSNYDFQDVDIAVFAFDTDGAVVAVNRTVLNTVVAHEERYFKVSWPKPLPADTIRIRVEASTNVFENTNFIKTHGVDQPFQEL